jgi:hypothetical protein
MKPVQSGSSVKLWMAGLRDTLVAAKMISMSQIPHRNRLAVILLDSAFETACRAYLRHISKIQLEETHKHRDILVKTIKSKLTEIDNEVWETIDFYYQEIRNDFYHQTSMKTITDDSLFEYSESVGFVIDIAFKVDSTQLVDSMLQSVSKTDKPASSSETSSQSILITSISDRVHKIIVAVDTLNPKSFSEVNDFFKKEGDSTKLTKDEFTNIVARHTGSKRNFYFNKDSKRWELSSLGRFKLTQLKEEFGNGR